MRVPFRRREKEERAPGVHELTLVAMHVGPCGAHGFPLNH